MGVDFYSSLGGPLIEAPRGWGVGEGSEEGAVPLPRKFFDCGSQNGEF